MSKFRHRLVLANSIESRDGTLNADSKMKNMVAENVEGELVAVKRPGITSDVELPPGLAQGLFSLNGLAYAIIDDALFEFSAAAIGGGGSQESGTEGGWEQIPGVLPFTIYPELFAESFSGTMILIGEEKLPESSYKYVFSSMDAVTWQKNSFVAGAYPKDWPWYGQDYSKWTPNYADVFFAGGYFWTSYYNADKHYFSRSPDLISWEHIYKRDFFVGIYNTWLPTDVCVNHNGALLRFHTKFVSFAMVYSTTDGVTWTNPESTNLDGPGWVKKIISRGGALYAFRRLIFGQSEATHVLKSTDNGLTWSMFSGVGAAFVDCVSTNDGILVVTANNETWMIDDQGVVTNKNYTLPDSPMKNGHLLAVGPDFFMIGCGDSYNTAFKLLDSSGPVGTPL